MSPELSDSSVKPNVVLNPDQLPELFTLADEILSDQRPEHEGDPQNPAKYTEWSSESCRGLDGTRYYISRYYADPDENLALSISIENKNDEDSQYVNIHQDGTVTFEDVYGQAVDSIENEPGNIITPAMAYDFSIDYLNRMKEQKERVKQKTEKDKAMAEIAESANFSELSTVDQETVDRILVETAFQGEPFNDRRLTPELLREIDLVPRYKQQITDKLTAYFSDIYEYDGRQAVLAITDHEGQLVARTFYLSGSQNVWRYLPAYGNKKEAEWFNKGVNENSLNLPIKLQSTLNQLSGIMTVVPQTNDAKLVFFGTVGHETREFETRYLDVVNPTNNEYASSAFVDLNTVVEDGATITKRPEDLVYTSEFESKYPDFKGAKEEWAGFSRTYGPVNAKVIPSKDGTWDYLFFTDSIGRTWLGQVDIVDSPIRPTLLRSQYFGVGLLTAPVYEYKGQAGDYGSEEFGQYVDVYDKYLKRLQIIRDFESSAV